MGMADVTLVLQNSEEEMQINHRVFRTGESEYRLNGKIGPAPGHPGRALEEGHLREQVLRHRAGRHRHLRHLQADREAGPDRGGGRDGLLQGQEAAGREQARRRRAEPDPARGHHRRGGQGQELPGPPGRRGRALPQAARAHPRADRPPLQDTAASSSRPASARSRPSTTTAWTRSGTQDARLAEEERTVNHKRKEAWDLEQTLKTGQERLYSLKAQIARAEAERDRETRRVEDLEVLRRRAGGRLGRAAGRAAGPGTGAQPGPRGARRPSGGPGRARKPRPPAWKPPTGTPKPASPPGRPRSSRLRADAIQKLAELTAARNEQAKIEKEIELIHRQEEKLRTRRDETDRAPAPARRSSATRSRPSGPSGAAGLANGSAPKPMPGPPGRGRRPASTPCASASAPSRTSATRRPITCRSLRKLEAKERQAAAVPDVSRRPWAPSPTWSAPMPPTRRWSTSSGRKKPARWSSVPGCPRRPGRRRAAGQFPAPSPGRRRRRRRRPPLRRRHHRPAQGPAQAGSRAGRPPAPPPGRLHRQGHPVRRPAVAGPPRPQLHHPSGGRPPARRPAQAGPAPGRTVHVHPGDPGPGRPPGRPGRGHRASRPRARGGHGRQGRARTPGSRPWPRKWPSCARALIDLEKRSALVLAERDKLENDLALIGHDLEILAMDRHGFLEKQERHTAVLRTLEDAERLRREAAEAEERELRPAPGAGQPRDPGPARAARSDRPAAREDRRPGSPGQGSGSPQGGRGRQARQPCRRRCGLPRRSRNRCAG